ncbi:uncharacterized protein [Sinocyclocheilus grahami]|uniref:uncharacterized protein n=1 Tax=Sinocyclocheilus grahami TaxID=75366 RepID=UPI0007AC531E|nr:PREDICTED: uncharacterized protein LOC107562434 [Sinocyclocheilus grahami]
MPRGNITERHFHSPVLAGTSTIPVRGRKGGTAILTYEYEARDISDIRFIRHRKPVHFADLPICEEYKSGSGRVCKKEACAIIIKDLIFSDAGKYIFRFKYKNALTDLKYQLHIYDEISMKIGEELKLDVLLSDADKVQHQSSGSKKWKEVWKRGHGVQNHQLDDRDGNLTINNFTANDSGTYRVLGSAGEILITVTVEDELKSDAEQHSKCRCWNLLLLLFCLVYHSETPPVGSHSVTRKKADSFTLPCKVEDNEIIYLIRQSKIILVCQNEECENKNKNVQGVCKKGACDVTIKNLSFSDAGKYILRFNYKNDPKEKKQEKEKTYRLCIHDEVSVKTGEQLKLDVLSNADKVQHQNETSAEWTEIWSRSDRDQSDRLTDSDGTLTINNFTASDAGTYRVLDTEGEILITVTVTESRRESKGKLDDTEQHIK